MPGDGDSSAPIRRLSALVVDGSKPAIVRATALSLLPQFTANVTPEMIKAYLAGVGDADPLVRAAAVDALAPFAPEETAVGRRRPCLPIPCAPYAFPPRGCSRPSRQQC